MAFQNRADNLNFRRFRAFHLDNTVRIAHRHHTTQNRAFSGADNIGFLFFDRAERYQRRFKLRHTHIHADIVIIGNREHHASGLRADTDIPFVGQPFEADKPAKQRAPLPHCATSLPSALKMR